ncbi:MAG: hypothetical protein QJR09_05335 [Micrococcus sp.]|nr:hypothetical protein [Micrococcus sp.]
MISPAPAQATVSGRSTCQLISWGSAAIHSDSPGWMNAEAWPGLPRSSAARWKTADWTVPRRVRAGRCSWTRSQGVVRRIHTARLRLCSHV